MLSGMGFFEGFESDVRSGERSFALKLALAVLGFWERLTARLR
jgi:hypothetical protein